MIIILQPDNIIFTQIAAELNFNYFQRALRSVRQAMHLTAGNITVLPDLQIEFARIERYMRRALRHHPVLAAVLVFLQTDLLPRMNLDALDLGAIGF